MRSYFTTFRENCNIFKIHLNHNKNQTNSPCTVHTDIDDCWKYELIDLPFRSVPGSPFLGPMSLPGVDSWRFVAPRLPGIKLWGILIISRWSNIILWPSRIVSAEFLLSIWETFVEWGRRVLVEPWPSVKGILTWIEPRIERLICGTSPERVALIETIIKATFRLEPAIRTGGPRTLDRKSRARLMVLRSGFGRWTTTADSGSLVSAATLL